VDTAAGQSPANNAAAIRNSDQLTAKSGLGLVQLAGHIYVLRSLAWEHKHDRLSGATRAVNTRSGIESAQRAHSIGGILATSIRR